MVSGQGSFALPFAFLGVARGEQVPVYAYEYLWQVLGTDYCSRLCTKHGASSCKLCWAVSHACSKTPSRAPNMPRRLMRCGWR